MTLSNDPDLTRFGNAKLLIGLHAKRSARIAIRFQRSDPDRRVMIALTGTDVYRDLPRGRNIVTMTKALQSCDRIIALQPLMIDRLPARWQPKTSVVMMDMPTPNSRLPNPTKRKFTKGTLNVCVVGHLRREKDPFRAQLAIRKLKQHGSIKITHAGNALSPRYRQMAEKKNAADPNWNWLGSVSRNRVDQLMRQSDLLVNSSIIEGAPNILFEAMSFALPMIVSRIDGHTAILGTDYPGYFPAGDTDGLRRLLLRAANERCFRESLCQHVRRISKRYKRGNEKQALLNAIKAAVV